MDEDCKVVLKLENIMIKAQAETFIEVADMDKVQAVIFNDQDKGYGEFSPDLQSLYFLESRYSLIQDPISRLTLIKQMCSMFERGVYPIQKLPVLINSISEEDNTIILEQFNNFILKGT